VAAVKADYYELLGVPPDADTREIRTAFHAAARDVHPYVSDSPDEERHFRDLAEAYSVLSRPAARLLYDRFGYRGRGNSAVDEELWDVGRPGGPRGESLHVPIELRAFEASAGTSRLVRYEAARTCSVCEGRGTTGERDPDCSACGGSGRRRNVSDLGTARFLRVEPCPVCGGDLCAECGGAGREFAERQLQVDIPSGLEDGTQLRVDGEGDVGDRGGAPGDLLLDVHVLPEPRDSRALRLVSFVLFAAAIAILLVYVLLN
jgi:molecular chaperone DnaJ